MKNSVNRDIPENLGYQPFSGSTAACGTKYRHAVHTTQIPEQPRQDKLRSSLGEAIKLAGLKDGMTISFHHHFRDGDYIVNKVMAEIVALGIKDITIAASSLGTAHDPVAEYIKDGIVTGIQTSGIRGKIGEVVSQGYLKTPAVLRSHGGRVRAIEQGEVHIDVAFIGAPTADCMGNARGYGGKSDCGVLGYSVVDSQYADQVIVITDTLVDFPNLPAPIHGIDVDHVVVIDEIGNSAKIASQAARFSTNPRDLKMAKDCVRVMTSTPWFKDGFTFQTGAGGPSLAANRFLEPELLKHGITMSWIIGGITAPAVELLNKGLVKKIIDTQDFDITAVNSVNRTPGHIEMSASEYANPANKGAFVNRLDFVILAALEIDTDFNVNVITGSDGILRGAPGGHPDTAAGSRCCIIVTPLIRGRMATVCDRVITVTTPGEDVDVLVTDYGIAVNPLRQDIIDSLNEAGIEHCKIEELRDRAYSLVGKPDSIEFEDQIVAVLEARDGSLLDVVRKIKPYVLD